MIVNDFEQPPQIHDGQFVSAYDINLWARNCAYLDQMAYRREPVFDSLAREDLLSSAHHTVSGFLLCRGSIMYQPHYTNLVVAYRRVGAIAGTGRLRIFIAGVQRAEFVPASGDGIQVVSLAGQSYAAGAVLLIEIRTFGLGTTDRTSEWWIKAVYATPAYASPTIADPSLPVIGPTAPPTSAAGGRPWIPMSPFGAVYPQTALNILSNNQLHLFDRMNQVPLAGNRSYLNLVMSDKAVDWEIWTGTVVRMTTEGYRLAGSLTLLSANSDTIKVYMNDVLVYTLGPYTTVGTHTFSVLLPLPADPPGVKVIGFRRTRVKLVYKAASAHGSSFCSRLTILTHRTDPMGASYPALALPRVLVPGANYSQVGLTSVLNSIVALLNAIKARVDASGSFTTVRAYRDNFGYDEHGRRSLDRFHPWTFQRRGSRLVVYGKNVQLGFGGMVYELDEDNHNTYKYKFANEQTIVPGDKYDIKTIYLDSIKGLYPGDWYYLVGDVTYAAEWMK